MSFWVGGSVSNTSFLSLKKFIGSLGFDEDSSENLYCAWTFFVEQYKEINRPPFASKGQLCLDWTISIHHGT